MIKWVGFGKSLKQFFIISLISCFILLGGSFVSAGYTRQVGTYGYNPYLQSLDINLTRAGNPLTSSLGYTKQIFVIQQTSSDFCAWFWNDGLPYNYCTRRSFRQGNIQSYQVCSEILDISQTNKPGNCVANNVGESTKEIIKNFLSSLTTDDYYWFNYSTTDFGWGEFCISNHSVSSSFCFSFNSSSTNFTNTLNLTGGLKFDSFPTSVLENPPSSSSGGGGGSSGDIVGVPLDSVEGALQYYENVRGLNKNICYIGIGNMTTQWGSSVSFHVGQGLDIFQAYNALYGNSDLDKVYVWINNWLINYEQWFNRDGNPLYLTNYNSGTNQVDIYYDDLTFPFANNPVGVYFMASNIKQFESGSPYDIDGTVVVDYCNLKINSGTFDEILDDATKYNVNTYIGQVNKTKGLNKDGTESGFSTWGSGDAFLNSGVDIAFSGNTSIKNTLKEFFTELDSSLSELNVSSNYKILPTWLITAFLMVVLFKFLRKK